MQKILLFTFVFLAENSKKFKYGLYRLLFRVKHMLTTETVESKRMLKIYYSYTKGECSKQDLKWANHQFGDVLKTFGISSLLILPFAPLTLPLIIKISEKLGVKILPDSFDDDSSGPTSNVSK